MVAIYCRISGRKSAGKDVSIEVQKTAGINFAEDLKLPYKLYIDVGISGAKSEIAERPAFADMFEDIKDKKVSVVYAYDQSRIVRQTRIWYIFIYVLEENRCTYYEAGKEVDFDDPITKLNTGIIALIDELYTKTTSKKVKAANRANAEKGKGHGVTAYGFKKNKDGYLEIDAKQAEIIKDIFKWSLNGVGTYTIANTLNDLGVPPKSHQFKNGVIVKKDKYTNRVTMFPRDKVKWRGNVLYDMLTNTIYKGQRHYGGVVKEIPSIITTKLWDQVNENLTSNKKNVGPKNKFKYLLNGLIVCQSCNAEFRGKYRASGRNKTYSCKGSSRGLNCKTGRGLNIPKFESFIISHLFESKDLYNTLSNLKVNEEKVNVYKTKLQKRQGELKSAENAKKHFYKLLTDPDLKEDEKLKLDYLKAIAQVNLMKKEVDNIEATLSDLSSSKRKKKLDRVFRGYNYKLNFDQIKKSTHELIEQITVKYLHEEKKFILQLQYRGFDEQSIFATDHNQIKWVNLSHYKTVPKIEEDKQRDDQLFDYFATKENYTKKQLIDTLKEFEAWEDEYGELPYAQLLHKVKQLPNDDEESVINIMTRDILLQKDELYDFNLAPS